MTALLSDLIELATSWVWIAALVFVRVGAAMAVMPGFGEQAVPARIKLAAALAFAALILPAIAPDYPAPLGFAGFASHLGTELVAGFALGILFRLFVIALQIAGTVAAQSTSLSQFFGAGLGAEPQPAFATLFVLAAIALATMAGLHVRIVEGFLWTYELFPPGTAIGAADFSGWGVERIAHSFALGFSLAGPFVLVAVIYNLGLGVINRAMPQLMVAFVGAPAISFGGLFLLLISTPFLLSIWLERFLAATAPGNGAL